MIRVGRNQGSNRLYLRFDAITPDQRVRSSVDSTN